MIREAVILSCVLCNHVAWGQGWTRHTIDDASRGADGVRLADVNGDGRLDHAAWRTSPLPCTVEQQAWMFALPMQVDGRHGSDLIVGSKGDNATVGWLEAPPDPRKVVDWKCHPLYRAGWIMSLQARDEDGDLDVLTCEQRHNLGVIWYENPTRGK